MPDFDSDPYFEYKCRRVNDPVAMAKDLGIPLKAPGTYRPQEGAIESARMELRNLFADADDADSSAIEKLILRDTKLKATRPIWLSTIIEQLEKRGHLPIVSSWAIFRALEESEVIVICVKAQCTLPRPTSSESLEYRNLNRLGFAYTAAHRQRRDELRTTRNFEFVQPRFTTGVALFPIVRSAGVQQDFADEQVRRRELGLDDRNDSALNIFRRLPAKAKSWMLRYNGCELFALPDSVGLGYIHRLIESEGRTLTANQLKLGSQARRVDPEGRTTMGAVSPDSEGPRATKSEPIVDKQTLSECRKEIERLNTQIETAKLNRDEASQSRAQQEKKAVQEYCRKASGLGGKPKKLPGEQQKATKAVRKAINEAVEKIRATNPEFGQHLRNSLDGNIFRYKSEPQISWNL